jgi:hypothetical protein
MMARLIMETVRGVQTHFKARAGEWFCAAMLTDWGFRVARQDQMFTGPETGPMLQLFHEETWGYLALLIGVARLLALAINGTLHDRLWYSRYSPHIRSGMAFLSIFVWSIIALGYWKSGVNTTALSFAPYLAAFDIYNAVRASQDAARMDKAYEGGGRIPNPT